MGGRTAGTRRGASYLEAGSQLLGTVTQVAGQILLRDGAVNDLPLAFASDTDSGGPFRVGADQIRHVVGGASQMDFATSQTTFLNHLQANANLTAVAGRLGGWRGMQRAGDLAPAALAAGNNNNYAGLAGYAVGRMTGDGGGTSVITGIAPDTADGDELLIVNIGAATFNLGHQNANSTAGNRIICTTGVNIPLATEQMAWLWYDATTARWRAFKVP